MNSEIDFKETIRGGAWFALFLLFTSCATFSKYPGVGRIRHYEISNTQVPPQFDGFRVAFASDFHFPSKLTAKRLKNVVRALQSMKPDLLLLGGDYQNGCGREAELFCSLAEVQAPYGKYAVLGNHDMVCRDSIANAMEHSGIRLLEQQTDTVYRGGGKIMICGVSFPLKDTAAQKRAPIEACEEDYAILLCHNPDYAEEADVLPADLVLAGHTHGGQVTLFYCYAPIKKSKYGFLTGKKRNSKGVPVIVTNGLGTSRKKIRFCAPSEVVLVTLKRSGNE